MVNLIPGRNRTLQPWGGVLLHRRGFREVPIGGMFRLNELEPLHKEREHMHGRWGVWVLCGLLTAGAAAHAQKINEYMVKRAPGKITVDGKLDEPGWKNVELTAPFMIYNTGATPKFPTQAKMLWDNQYLYIAFIMTDNDVWAKTKKWNVGDPCLCAEEVAEVFIDPDGDSLNYLEAEINPYGALMALRIDKTFDKGGTGDYSWTYKNLKIGIGVQGTLNDSTDVDTSWICELGFPFSEIAFSAPTLSFPPKPGESWRINLYRYEYIRPLATEKPELTAWNRTKWTDTDKDRGFHAPDYFGKIIYSSEIAGK
jgi:hypothetical protein